MIQNEATTAKNRLMVRLGTEFILMTRLLRECSQEKPFCIAGYLVQ